MKRIISVLMLALSVSAAPAFAAEHAVSRASKAVAKDTGKGAKEVGKGSEVVAKDTAKGTKKVGKGTAKAVKTVF